MPTRAATRQALDGALRFRKAETENFVSLLRRVARSMERQITDYVSGFSLKDGLFLGSAEDLSRLAHARNEIDRMLVKTGYAEASRDFVDRKFPQLSGMVNDAWRSLGIPAELSATSEAALEVVANLSLDRFANLGVAGSDALRRGVVESVTGGTRWSTWAKDLRDALSAEGGFPAYAGTYARTAIDQVNRLTAKGLGDDAGVQFWLYFGGLIETSREFCVEHDGNVYHSDEISAMDNGQTADVFTTCGGYNCRHEWLPVLDEDVGEEDWARAEGDGLVEARA